MRPSPHDSKIPALLTAGCLAACLAACSSADSPPATGTAEAAAAAMTPEAAGAVDPMLCDPSGRFALAGMAPASGPRIHPQVGAVFSADIAVPEHEREVRFYARILGTGETPLWREDLMNNLGVPVIGLGNAEDHPVLPLQWMPHIQVADVAASAERAVELGGVELLHAHADDGTSAWAVLQDPNGSAFGVIPVVSEELLAASIPPGAMDPGAPPMGHIAWFDLNVADPAATRDFYEQVVGWTVEGAAGAVQGQEAFALLGADGRPLAGICPAPAAEVEASPVWLIYLPVSDLETSLRLVEEEGGRVLELRRGEDGVPTSAVIEDPVGARLALIAGAGEPAAAPAGP